MATTPLYINKHLLQDGDNILPVYFSRDDATDLTILNDSFSIVPFSPGCGGYWFWWDNTNANSILKDSNSAYLLASGAPTENVKELIFGYYSTYNYRDFIYLTHSGTVESVDNGMAGCRFRGWDDCTSFFMLHGGMLAGVKSDGRVVSAGSVIQGSLGSWGLLTDCVFARDMFSLSSTGKVKYHGSYGTVYGNNYSNDKTYGWSDITFMTTDSLNDSRLCVGVKSNGKIVVSGYSAGNYTDVLAWTNIARVAIGYTGPLYGVKTDGSVLVDMPVVLSGNLDVTATITSWTGIKEICGAGNSKAIYGLKTDGTVVYAACAAPPTNIAAVSSWTGIIQLVVSEYWAVGVKADGTCVATGDYINPSFFTNLTNVGSIYIYKLTSDSGGGLYIANKNGGIRAYDARDYKLTGQSSYEPCVRSLRDGFTAPWVDIVSAVSINSTATSLSMVVGLKVDGTIIAEYVGSNSYPSTNTPVAKNWTNIKQVSCGGYNIFGLNTSGSVGVECIQSQVIYNSFSMTNTQKIAATDRFVVGLKNDNTVQLTVSDYYKNNSGYKDAPAIISAWTGVVDILADLSLVLGLKSDNTAYCCNVYLGTTVDMSAFTNITKYTLDNNYVLGMRADGSCVSTYSSSQLASRTDVIDICNEVGVVSSGKCVRNYTDSSCPDSNVISDNDYILGCVDTLITHHPKYGWSGNLTTPAASIAKLYTARPASYVYAFGILKIDGTCEIYTDSGYSDSAAWTDLKELVLCDSNNYGITNAGRAYFSGYSNYNRSEISNWTNIVGIAETYEITAGLRADGTVVCTSYYAGVQTALSAWRNVVKLAGTSTSVKIFVGLKNDNTLLVYASGYEQYVPSFTNSNFIDIIPGYAGVFALKADGTVVFFGKAGAYNGGYTTIDVSSWTKIKEIRTSRNHAVGLRTDGTVVATGLNTSGQCDVSDYTDVVDIAVTNTTTLLKLASGKIVIVGAAVSELYPPAINTYSVAPLHFQYSSGVEIPFIQKRVRRGASNTEFDLMVELQVNKTTLGSDRFINIIHGDTTKKVSLCKSKITGKRISKAALGKAYSSLLSSYSDCFYGTDIIIRHADGTVVTAFSRSVVASGGALTSVDLIVSLLAQQSTDLCICYGASPVTDDLAVPASVLQGTTPAAASSNPTPGVYWDYASLGETYEVFGADGLKVADAVQYIYSIDYLVSDGIKSGEVQSNMNNALSSAGDGLKLGEARAHDATLGGSAADGVKGSELTFGSITMPAASADNFYGGEHSDDRLNSQNIAQEVLNTTELDSTTCVMPMAGGDSLVAAEGGTGALLVYKQTADGVATADAGSGNINATHALAETTLQHNVAGAVSSMTDTASDGVATQDADQYQVSVLMLGSDGVTGSETINVLAELFGAGIDSVSIADPGSGFIDATLAVAEAFTTADGGVMGLLVERAASDALTGGDTPGGALILPAVVSDTTKGADGNACAVSIPMTASEGVKTSDSLFSQAALVGACLDAVYQTDGGYTTLQAIGVCVDAWLNSDPTGGFIENTRAVSDGLGISDGNSVTNTAFAQVSDILKGSEALFSIYTGFLTAIDGFLAQDVVNLGNFYTLAAADGISNGEAMAVSAILLNALSEVVKNSDSQANSSSLKGSAADGLKSSDSQLNNHNLLGVLYENMLTSEQISPNVAYINTILDGMLSTDATAGGLILTALQSDGFTGKELLTNYAQILVELGEFAYCGGLSAGYKQFADIILSDGARVGDSSALYVAILLAAVDGLQISEELNTNDFSIYLEVVGEQLRASDANQTKLAAGAVATDSLKSLDTLLLSIGAAAVAQDCLSTSDTAKTALEVLALCGDFVFGADTALPYAIKLANAVESVTWSESGRVEAVIGVTAAEGVSVFEAATTILQATSVASDKLKTFEQTIVQGSHLGDGVCVVVEAVFDELRKLPVRHEFKLARNTEYDTIKPRNTGEFKVSSACITFKVRK